MAEGSLGGWLKRRRQAMGLTQEQLARQIGCAAITLRKIESDERRPSAQMAERLAAVLGVPVAERPAFVRFARAPWKELSAEDGGPPPWFPAIRGRLHLPAAVTPLIGREKDMARVRAYLENPHIRLVTLTGPPGIGKMSLGLASARDVAPAFAGGIFFAGLAALDDPTLLPGTIAAVLGDETRTISTGRQLAECIGDNQVLIVLANCEHLVERLSPLVSELLVGCPRLKILATSREALRIPGEWVHVVGPLTTPAADAPVSLEAASGYPALMLFAERARAVRSDFDLTPENLPAVASICARLDGLPLAIELIAARVRFMAPEALLEHMSDSFVLSADGMRASSARQKTLAGAIRWSYDCLPPEEQTLFARLAVFSGGFTIQAAESVCAGSGAGPVPGRPVGELVMSLVDKSLLQRTSPTQSAYRFCMLDTIQHFALDCLRSSAGEAEMRGRHLAYFLEMAEQGNSVTPEPLRAEWIKRIEREHDNFRAALEWGVTAGQTEPVLRLLAALAGFWELCGRTGETLCWLNKILALPDVSDYPLAHALLLERTGELSQKFAK